MSALLVSAIALTAWGQELSREKELALGRGLAEQLRRDHPSVDDAVLNGYLAKLASRINARAQGPFPLSIDVTRDLKGRMAGGLPGGFLRVPLGVVAEAATEQDLAFALAHGIAHVVGRLGIYTGLASVPLVLPWHTHSDEALLPRAAVALYQKGEEQADALARSWVADFEPGGEFEAARERARELVEALMPRPSRKGPPTLRRK